MEFDAQKLCTPWKERQALEEQLPEEERRCCFEIDPDKAYPATLQEFKKVLEGKSKGMELFARGESPDEARRMIRQVLGMREEDFVLALTPRDDCKPEQVARRAKILELARKWFTKALHVKVGKPIGLRILKGSGDWRL